MIGRRGLVRTGLEVAVGRGLLFIEYFLKIRAPHTQQGALFVCHHTDIVRLAGSDTGAERRADAERA